MSDEMVRLTYSELAKARGITLAAARRMTLRHKWPKQIGNDGLSHILVPASALVRPENDGTVATPGDAPSDQRHTGTGTGRTNGTDAPTSDTTAAVRSFSDAVASLGVQLAREQERADLAESCFQEAEDRAQTAEGRIRELTAQLETEQRGRAENKERADLADRRAEEAESRAQAAETWARDLQEQLTAEMTENRRIIGTLTEQLAARRSWWPWHR